MPHHLTCHNLGRRDGSAAKNPSGSFPGNMLQLHRQDLPTDQEEPTARGLVRQVRARRAVAVTGLWGRLGLSRPHDQETRSARGQHLTLAQGHREARSQLTPG